MCIMWVLINQNELMLDHISVTRAPSLWGKRDIWQLLYALPNFLLLTGFESGPRYGLYLLVRA